MTGTRKKKKEMRAVEKRKYPVKPVRSCKPETSAIFNRDEQISTAIG